MESGAKVKAFEIIEKLQKNHLLAILFAVSGVSKSGYYKWRKRRGNESKDAELTSHLKAIHALRPYYGYRRLTVALRKEGFLVNHKKILRLMKIHDICSVIRKKRHVYGQREGYIFSNILNRKFTSDEPYKKLVTDITYLPTSTSFMFLSVILDLYNNEIVAYKISDRNNLNLVLETVAQLDCNKIDGTILHSDQGFQYTTRVYTTKMAELKITGSHSRKANCLDNAAIESFFSHMKTETLVKKKNLTNNKLIEVVDDYIKFYNTSRFQKRLGYLSPVEYREKVAA